MSRDIVTAVWRVPTEDEWNEERLSWASNNSAGAFASPLKLNQAGRRLNSGLLQLVGEYGNYWSSTHTGTSAHRLEIRVDGGLVYAGSRGTGRSVRLIKKEGLPLVAGNKTFYYRNADWTYQEVQSATGRIWMDRNLGATQVATSLTDADAYGDLFQWGRGDDGHQLRTSGTTAVLSSTDIPGHGDFITRDSSPWDWRSPQNHNLWELQTVRSNMRLLTIGAMQQQGNLGIWIYKGVPFEYEEVTNPTTGRTWMDRNLGASRVATAVNDVDARGDYFQWGRLDDLHQNVGSATTVILSNADVPGHGDFILNGAGTQDWRDPQNDDLWQPPGLINVPAPPGWRVPTITEWDEEIATWIVTADRAQDAYNSLLKLPLTGSRRNTNGTIGLSDRGYYISSTIKVGATNNSRALIFSPSFLRTDLSIFRASGIPLRLIKI